MADTFHSYDELALRYTEGEDYTITANNPDSDVCIVAPHAGEIELGTSEIAKAIAKVDYGLYLFEGCLRNGNTALHITSHNFDEPRALRLVRKSRIVLGVHGRADSSDEATIYLGGLGSGLVDCIVRQLTAVGFECLSEGHKFLAQNEKNICNRGSSDMGAQIEVPRTLRNRFRKDAELLDNFARAIRVSIEDKLNI